MASQPRPCPTSTRLRRVLLAAGAACLLPIATARASETEEVRALAERVLPAVAAIEHRLGVGESDNPLDAQARSCAFLISPRGHLVASADFVGDRGRYDLWFPGSIKTTARVLGSDPTNRITVLQLEDPAALAARLGGSLPILSWGRSRDLEPGHAAFTVGNPFDSLRLDGVPAFSRGIVASIGLAGEGPYSGMAIETDAAVNPGSFGGPLLDREGRVVGVLTPSFSPRRWLGMAVPSDQVRLAVEAIVAGQPLARGRLGLAVASRGGEADLQGLEVKQVAPGSPAAAAGIAAGDRLVRLGATPLYDADDLARALERHAPGSEVPLTVRRGEALRLVEAVLDRGQALAVAERPRAEASPATRERRRAPAPPTSPGAPKVRLGVQVEPAKRGARVTGVEEGSAAAAGGLAEGDVIVGLIGRAGRFQVRTLDDLGQAVAQFSPGEAAGLVVLREGGLRVLRIRFGEPQAQRPRSEPRAQPHPQRPRPGASEPGYLGVYLDPQRRDGGAMVDGAVEGSPADRAGLREGDLVVAVDGRRVRTTQELADLLRGRRAGETLSLTVRRRDGERRLTVTLERRPQAQAEPEAPPASRAWLGVALEARGGRLVITELAPDGPLARVGARPGDVLLAAEGRPITDLEALGRQVAAWRPGQTVRLELERAGWTKTFEVRVAARP